MCSSCVLLIVIECKRCKTHFYMCRACYRGHVYCSSKCREEAYAEVHRRSQSNYRTSDQGREKNRLSEQNRRRIGRNQETKKSMADDSIIQPSFRVIQYPIVPKAIPRCSFCGAYGKIVDAFPPA